MIHHTAAVRRGVERALLVGDMPFMTYHVSPEEALRNAGRLIQEGGAEAVKLEGARSVAASIRRIVDTGIPVMGHIGLTPQSIHALSGYRVQGRGEDDARRLMEEAKILEDAGCFSIVLECVTWEVAEEITNSLSIPTIGIGSGGGCDGQVLVLNDMIGLDQRKPPSFVKQYAQVGRSIKKALRGYAAEVREGTYPDRGHAFFSAPRKKIDPAEIRDFARTEKPADEDENRNG
jgi:3-methyl-2-oxobutanoate hydroxymethyltransferase